MFFRVFISGIEPPCPIERYLCLSNHSCELLSKACSNHSGTSGASNPLSDATYPINLTLIRYYLLQHCKEHLESSDKLEYLVLFDGLLWVAVSQRKCTRDKELQYWKILQELQGNPQC